MWDWIHKLVELKQSGTRCVMATVTKVIGSAPREMGAKMIVLEDGEFWGTIGGGKLESLVLEDAKRKFEDNVSQTKTYPLCIRAGQCCGGSVEVFLEVIGNGPHLYLFGAGHVGQAVCKTLVGTPFTVHVIDEREEWIDASELPASTIRHQQTWQDFVAKAEWDSEKTYVAVMTYLHDMDLAIISDVIKRNAKYVGLIGSKTKWDRFRLRLKNMEASTDLVEKVRCPIGLPTGGKAPQEVAISIAAELLKIHYGL